MAGAKPLLASNSRANLNWRARKVSRKSTMKEGKNRVEL
jgi:hypothetical protein